MALMIANDIGHVLVMGTAFDPSVYFVQASPLYAFIPLTTVTLFSGLMRSEPDGR
jgi:ABC-type nitrate/sulfonate/bicarbonate transport system permease component